ERSYIQAYKRVIKQAIGVAVDYGRLPPEVFDLLDIQVEAPSIPYKSALDEAQANQIRVQGGWKSRQTVQQEEGLDPEREMQNIEEYSRRMGQADKEGPAPLQEANFNPNEPRDWHGRWTKFGGEAGAGLAQNGLALPSSFHHPGKPPVFVALQAPLPGPVALPPQGSVGSPARPAPFIQPTPSGF